MASRRFGTSCDTTCSLRDVHRVMHAVVTRLSTMRPPFGARGEVRKLDAEFAMAQSDGTGEPAVAVADCNRARKTLPVEGDAR